VGRLPTHRSKLMRAWLRCQRSWLVVEPVPGYPDLNPVEPLWSNLKGVELANLAGDTLDDVIAAAERGIRRIRHTHHLAFSYRATVACPSGRQGLGKVVRCRKRDVQRQAELALGNGARLPRGSRCRAGRPAPPAPARR
jgi:hypothetical protein